MTASRTGGSEVWGRQRLIGVLAAVAVTAVLLMVGLVYAVYLAVAPDGGSSTAPPPPAVQGLAEDAQARRDLIAATPMLAVTPGDAQPAVPAPTLGPVLLMPPATTAGPVGVPSGFPRTPAGAVAQLAAIETSVFQAMSIPATEQIHRQWALPGVTDADGQGDEGGEVGVAGTGHATGVAGWEITRHVQSFLGTAQMGPEKDLTTTVTATPAAAQIKGVDGQDWVLACVLLEVRAVIVTEARIGFGHCERMQWQDGRWLIAPGQPPARAPSTWPGSQRSIEAGWHTWVEPDEETISGGHSSEDSSGVSPSAGPDGPWLEDATEGGNGGA